jgi:hypothetical protein
VLAVAAVSIGAFAGALSPTARADVFAPTRSALQDQYNRPLISGMMGLRAPPDVGGGHLVGDNTDPNGLRWTKCTNLGLDLLVTLVADAKGLMPSADARAHVGKVLDVLSGLTTFAGLFPEVIRLDPNNVHAEDADGRIRYSSIDSAWVTVALSFVDAAYQGTDDALAARARSLIAKQDYAVLVDQHGTMSAGFFVNTRSNRREETFPFSYDDLNSEARPLVNALVGLGKLPLSAWTGMHYRWVRKEGSIIARGWHYSAFVEMTGQLFFDESSLAPQSLGRSHTAYIDATRSVAARNGHTVFGYAPACDPAMGYLEYGLDRPNVVSPYAAAELAMTGNARALSNLEAVLRALPQDGRPAPDGLEPKSSRLLCRVARTLDQSLLFLGLNVDAVWRLARGTGWYASAEQRIVDLDRTARPPPDVPMEAQQGDEHGSARAPAALAPAAASPDERAATVDRGRAVLRSVLDAVRAMESTAGGHVSAADGLRRYAVAKAVSTWLDLLPHGSMVVTREQDMQTAAPQFRADLQVQAVLSPAKFAAGAVAEDAAAQAAAASLRQEHDALADALNAYARLYLAERRVARLREHEESLRALMRGLTLPRASANGDALLLEARRAAIAAKQGEADSSRRGQAAHLEALVRQKLDGSGLDPRLDLTDVLDVLSIPVRRSGTRVEEAVAALHYQRSLLALAESQMPYVPQLLASVLDVLVKPPQTNTGQSAKWSTDQVLGQATVGFDLRPSRTPERDAEQISTEAELWRLKQTIDQNRRVRAEARARRDGAVSAWLASRDVLESDASFADAARRFARGESDAGALVHASESLISARDSIDELFAEAVLCQVVLMTHGEATGATLPGGDAREPAFDEPLGRQAEPAATPDASVAAAEAASSSAYERAEAMRATFAGRIEMGVLYPLVAGSATALGNNTGLLLTAGGALLPPELRHPALLARISLFERRDCPEGRAARIEAELRAAQAVFARKHRLAQQAAVRLELASQGTAVREADRRLAFVTALRDALRQMKDQGVIDEATLDSEGETRVAAATADREEQRARWVQTQIAAQGLVDQASTLGLVDIREAEEADVALYGAEQLVGFETELRRRIAELELDRARAWLTAVRRAGASIDVALQGTREIGKESVGSSLGLGLSWTVDPPRTPSDISDAAAAVGRAEESVAVTQEALESEKKVAAADRDETARLRDIELQNRDRLRATLARLREEQAAEPELSSSAKLRAAAGVEALLFEAERRLVAVESRAGRALLSAMNLGVAPTPDVGGTAGPEKLPAATLAEAIDRLVESDRRVLVADAVARSMIGAPLRPPLVSGVHVAGPAFGVTFATQPSTSLTTVAGSTPARGLTGDIGVGVSLALSESFSFIETSAQTQSARTSCEAARAHAAIDALGAIASAWSAREKARLAGEREAAREKVALLTSPRLSAAQIGPEALANAESAYAAAQADVVEAQGHSERSRRRLVQRNAVLTDRVLDEFGQLVSADAGAALEKALNAVVWSGPAADVASARAKRDVAGAATGSAFFRLLDPITLFGEFEPFGEWDSPPSAGAGYGAPTRDAHIDLALRLGVNLKAIGEIADRAMLVSGRQGEMEVTERATRDAAAEQRVRVEAARASWRTAAQALEAARHAFEDTDRRYRAGEGGVSIDGRSEALEALFDAERAEIDARLAFLDAFFEVHLASAPEVTVLPSPLTESSNAKNH